MPQAWHLAEHEQLDTLTVPENVVMVPLAQPLVSIMMSSTMLLVSNTVMIGFGDVQSRSSIVSGFLVSITTAAISDEDYMFHILVNLPKKYLEGITAIENDLEQTTNMWTMDQMIHRSCYLYRREFYSESNVKDSDNPYLSRIQMP
jgi:hypothetical protein